MRKAGQGKNDNSLECAGDIHGELLHVWGRQDPHIPLAGRTKIRERLEQVGANFSCTKSTAPRVHA